MTEEWKGSVGERLLQLRNQKGMTQEDLAEYLNVSRQSVSKWELNKTLPDVEKLMQLSELYEVTLDYLVKGIEPVEESEATLDEKSVDEVRNVGIHQSDDLAQDTQLEKLQEDSGFEMAVHRIVFLLAMVVSGILCLCGFIFSGRIIANHTFTLDGKQQDVAHVNKMYEQYTLADVTVWDDEEKYHKEKVWIDVEGVREGDYIGYYYDEGDSGHILFSYYSKTLIVPLIVSVLLLIFTIIFWMGFRTYGGKNDTKGV